MRYYTIVLCAGAVACGGGGDGGGGTPPPVTVASVAISPPEPDTLFSLGQQVTLTATAHDAAGAVVSNAAIGFTSASTAVATVTNTGVVTAVRTGETTVSANVGTVTSSPVPIRVRQKLDNVAVAGSATSVAVGATLQVAATPRDARGSAIPGLPAAVFTTSDASRATVDATTGIVSGVAEGQATITATVTSPVDGAKSGSQVITVTAAGPPPAVTVRTGPGNAFNPEAVTIKAGGAVTWEIPTLHNVDFENANITDMDFGAGSSRTFLTPGTYRFRCDAHSTNFTTGMVGTVTVDP